jgi:hypothetical protein
VTKLLTDVGKHLHPTNKTWLETAMTDKKIARSVEPLLLFLYSALPQDNIHTAEFVYLESQMNSLKGVYFGRKIPNALNTDKAESELSKVLAKLKNTYAVYLYLANDHVETLYKDFLIRLRETWIKIGEKLHGLNEPKISDFYDKKIWETAFDTWHTDFIKSVQKSMNKCMEDGFSDLQGREKKNALSKKQIQWYKDLETQWKKDEIKLGSLDRGLTQESPEMKVNKVFEKIIEDLRKLSIKKEADSAPEVEKKMVKPARGAKSKGPAVAKEKEKEKK